MASASTEQTIVLSESDKKAVQKNRRKRQNLGRIILANSTRIDEVVGVGGRFEGRIVVFQADSAGPHIENTFVIEFDKMCEEEGWYKENQAPQMPHMNICDLSVFPAMSRRHCHLARASGGLHVLKEDQIWETAEEVWATLLNSKIASAYVHAYRIAEEVVRLKGDNRFLGERSGLSFGVRSEFNETVVGLSRRDGKNLPAPLRQREHKRPRPAVEEIAVERETDGDDGAAVGGVGDVGDVTAVSGVGDVGVGIVDCQGGGTIIIAGGDDPPSLVPEVTDMARRHALARAHALGLPPPPPLPYPPSLEPKDEMVDEIGMVEEA